MRFFAMLNTAYELEAERQVKAIAAIALGFADQKSKQKPLEELQRAADGIIPGDSSNDYSGMDILKNHMG